MFSFWKKSFSIDQQPNIKEQYSTQISMLRRIGLVDFSEETNLYSIVGIDQKKYVLPTYEELENSINLKKEIIKTKKNQGFTKLLIVPFALPLDKIIKKYEEVLRKHYANNNLFAKDTEGKKIKPELNKENPMNVWSDIESSDIKNFLIYFPENFKKDNNGGKTKNEIITSGNGWLFLLVEDAEIPKPRKGRKISKRNELESGKSPEEYLKTIKTNANYENELGLPLEGSIIYAISKLEETNTVTNNWLTDGCIEYCLGSFLATTEDVPWLSWNSDFNRVDIWKNNSWNQDKYMGTRTAFKIR